MFIYNLKTQREIYHSQNSQPIQNNMFTYNVILCGRTYLLLLIYVNKFTLLYRNTVDACRAIIFKIWLAPLKNYYYVYLIQTSY